MIVIAAETCAYTQKRNSACRYCSLHAVQLHRLMKWILIYKQVIKSRSAEWEGSVSAAPVASWITRQSTVLALGLSQPCRPLCSNSISPWSGAELPLSSLLVFRVLLSAWELFSHQLWVCRRVLGISFSFFFLVRKVCKHDKCKKWLCWRADTQDVFLILSSLH